MEKSIVIIGLLVLIIALVFIFWNSNLNSTKLESDQDFINFAIDAEKSLLTVYFVANPGLLREKGIKAIPINSKKDVAKILAPFWDDEVIDLLWRQGSAHMPKLPFGFYTERDLGLLEASNIRILSKSPNKVIVSGRVDGLDASYDRNMILIKTTSGWRAVGQ